MSTDTEQAEQPDATAPAAGADQAQPGELLDAASVIGTSLPRRLIKRTNAQRKHAFQVVIRRSALEAMQTHAKSRTDVEVCGVFVGDLYRDHFGPYLLISAAIAGHAATQRGSSVTFTADTWTAVMDKMEADHPDRKMAGWYHTHPDFGVFLSDADIFIQRNFFDLPWQAAIVIDPVRDETGSFVWRGGEPQREPFLIEEETTTTDWKKIQQSGGSTPGLINAIRAFFSGAVTPVLFVLLVIVTLAVLWFGLNYLEF
ncbi:MAG: Mov34/MPN/PAD-1 family protein [Planctomycetota bacterium]